MKRLLKSLFISIWLALGASYLTADLNPEGEPSIQAQDAPNATSDMVDICFDDQSSDVEDQPPTEKYSEDNCDVDAAKNEHNFSTQTYTDGIAAIVNNDIITMERVRMDVGPVIRQIQAESKNEQEFRKNLFNAEMDVVNSIINRRLIVEAFMAKGGKISETYEEKEYENYLRRVFGGNRLEFAKFLKEYGKSRQDFKTDVKERAIINFMMFELQSSQQEVSPLKIKEYYDSHTSAFFKPREIELKQIIVINEDCDANHKIEIINDLLEKGEDPKTVAEKYSDIFTNFDLGYILFDDLVPEVKEKIENLNVGEHSHPIVLGGSTYIFIVTGEHPAHQQTLQEASQAIENLLFYKYQEEARTEWIKKLRDRAYIKIFLHE